MIGNETFRGELRQRMSGAILFDEPAGRHTSIGVGGGIDALLFPEDEGGLTNVIGYLRRREVPFLPVGNWTNLIVRDGGFRGALVSLACLRDLCLRDEGKGNVLLLAGAGCPLSELVSLAMREALTGMEFCAGIPGSVGGAIRMNAGAYGGEIKDIVESANLLDASGDIHAATRDELPFAYRTLDLPAETIIIGAAIRLRRGEAEKIAGRVREIIGMRKEKHPLEFRNAGSVFKNPRDCPAGRLIEEAGLKGIRIGDAQVSEKHANFIVNRGHATAADILGLVALIQQRVLEKTGLTLETEVRIIGEQ
ncbi:MAG: UDP-N-acetylmuramate dehydrogenase [Proteobacteria bacterium]|nr:UDP-N-acetylmuramate dehydrogenase [Pseudomonadota bacterium]MBU4370884.1 UDP-N-acetylmuramate dehydrogenase [Pseudomonadota bacterium]MBU4581018.1 UDP-N-acetylmuramate dehydrogenase [Pseudomonadota bacterium]MCG2739139.1 UDP-N-acetylmuramate dehydrogenase [Syntrophaceae bacterium]